MQSRRAEQELFIPTGMSTLPRDHERLLLEILLHVARGENEVVDAEEDFVIGDMSGPIDVPARTGAGTTHGRAPVVMVDVADGRDEEILRITEPVIDVRLP